MRKSFVYKILLAILTVNTVQGGIMLPVQAVEVAESTTNEITMNAEFSNDLHANQQAVLTIEIDIEDEVAIKGIYADLSLLGGDSQVSISPELMRLSVSVTHDIAADSYDIPIRIVDELDNEYTTSATAQVVSDNEEGISWDEEIIYFMLTDRFYDGDSENNNPYALDYEGADNQRGIYQGGDFKGVTEKIDYLADLGITTIWISPIVDNIKYDSSFAGREGSFYGYHGYWALDFEALNPHFGTIEDFHEMIDVAAEHDIKIMVDVVLNHTGYGLNPDDANVDNPPEGFPTDEDRERLAGMIRTNPGRDALTMSLSGLPDLITEDPEVREQIVDWQQAWIDLSTTPNGNQIASFRVDTVKHVDMPSLQHFKNRIIEEYPTFNLIGEAWDSSHRSDGGFLHSGTMDGVLDFGFKGIANQYVNGLMEMSERDLAIRNEAIQSNATLGQFLSSHDEDGFLYSLANDLGKYKLAVSLQMTAKGQPVIYYGEELGQTGANNWPVYDNRYDLDWENMTDNEVLEHYQKLLSFRKSHSKLMARGDRQQIAGSNEEQWLIIQRQYEDDIVYLGFNTADESQEVVLTVDSANAVVKDEYSGKSYQSETVDSSHQVSISLPALADGGTALLVIEDRKIIE